MTSMATEVRPTLSVGTAVRIVDCPDDRRAEGMVGSLVEIDDGGDWNCCNGSHRYTVQVEGPYPGRYLVRAVEEVEPTSAHHTPGGTGEGTEEVRPGYSVGDRYQWFPGGVVVAVIPWDDPRLDRLYGGPTLDRFRTEQGYQTFVPMEVVRGRPDYEVGSVLMARMPDLHEVEDLDALTPEEQLLRLQRLVHRVASAEAVRRDWCNEINGVLAKLDLPEELSQVDRALGRRLRDNPGEIFQWREEPEPEEYDRDVTVSGTATWTISESFSITETVHCDHEVPRDEECSECCDNVVGNLDSNDVARQLDRFDSWNDDAYSLEWDTDVAESEPSD